MSVPAQIWRDSLQATNGFLQCIGIFMVEWQEEFDGTTEEIGWIGSFILIGYTVAGLAIALFGCRVSCRTMTMFGGTLACISLSFSLLATDIWHMFIVMLGAGFGLCCAQTGSISVVGFYVHKYIGIANGVVTSGASFGLLVISPLLAYLIELYSWRGAMLISAGIVANVCVIGALFRKTKSEQKSNRSCSEKSVDIKVTSKETNQDYISQDSTEDSYTDSCSSEENYYCCHQEHVNYVIPIDEKNMPDDEIKVFVKDGIGISCVQIKNNLIHSDVISLLLNTRLLFFNISVFLRGFAYFSSMVHFVALCVTNDISKTDATFLLSLMGICGASSRLSHGIFIDKKLITALHLHSLTLVIGGLSCFLIAISTSFATVTVFAVVFGTTAGVFHAVVPVAIRQILLEVNQLNMVKGGLGIAMAVACTGGLIGVPTIGYLYDITHDYAASCYVAGGLLVASGILNGADPFLVRWQRRRQRIPVINEDTASEDEQKLYGLLTPCSF
ncbi:monocarboxylate transporter 12-like [Amphiura filiformis]|uniref:monocarboxylate transporter 12-like n=1 Tax=Amphiura filiformis TaxID=82378 RepID=UPI003B2288F2